MTPLISPAFSTSAKVFEATGKNGCTRNESLPYPSQRLEEGGHPASPPTVGRLLHKLGYSLRVNVKKHEASFAHPDRELQFELLESQKQVFQAAGWPIISVDTREERVDWQLPKRRASLGKSAQRR